MTLFQSIRDGIKNVNANKRMIFFLWLLNFFTGFVFTIPFMDRFQNYTQNTRAEEALTEKLDYGWYQYYQYDFRNNDWMRSFSPAITNGFPFLSNGEAINRGEIFTRVFKFLWNLLFHWRINTQGLTVFLMIGWLYVLLWNFLSGGLIGTLNSKDTDFTVPNFLKSGAEYFGKFFRLSIISLIIYYLLFIWLFDPVTKMITNWSPSSESEIRPFYYQLIKNIFVFLILFFVNMTFDYAKIRMIVEDRISSLFAAASAFRFTLKHFLSAYSLYLILGFIGVLLMLIFTWVEGNFRQSTWGSIFWVFLIQQVYLGAHFWLKCSFYGSQLEFFRSSRAADQKSEVRNAEPAMA